MWSLQCSAPRRSLSISTSAPASHTPSNSSLSSLAPKAYHVTKNASSGHQNFWNNNRIDPSTSFAVTDCNDLLFQGNLSTQRKDKYTDAQMPPISVSPLSSLVEHIHPPFFTKIPLQVYRNPLRVYRNPLRCKQDRATQYAMLVQLLQLPDPLENLSLAALLHLSAEDKLVQDIVHLSIGRLQIIASCRGGGGCEERIYTEGGDVPFHSHSAINPHMVLSFSRHDTCSGRSSLTASSAVEVPRHPAPRKSCVRVALPSNQSISTQPGKKQDSISQLYTPETSNIHSPSLNPS